MTTTPPEPPKHGFSLTTRVATASALAASLAGAAAAMTSELAAHRLIDRYQDRTLLHAAHDLVAEMQEEFEEDLDEAEEDYGSAGRSLESVLRHEIDDVKLPGVRAAIWHQGQLLAGEPGLSPPPLDTCTQRIERGMPRRTCTVAFGADLLVLSASETRERAQQGLFGRAVLFGALIGALLGWALSRRMALWALSPLIELRDHVRRIKPDSLSDPRSAEALTLSKAARGEVEVEELRRAIVQLIERLGAALGQARAFAAEAAHELRTPLTSVAGELELLSESASEPERAGLSRVQQQVAELNALVQRLLLLTRAQAIAPEQAELVDLSDVVASWRGSLPAGAGDRVAVRLAEDVIVRGDAALLRAMLGNAIENAHKFSAGEVELRIAQHGGEAWLDVLDAGPGVAEAEREHVFEPFYRAARSRLEGTPGHGLGLALIAAVAQAHRGSAEFLRVPRGAHLRIRLPLWTRNG
jgi:signal transduction histidine kinase